MIKITGFDEAQKKLKELQRKVQELDGTSTVPLSELLTDSFLSRHTRFSSLAALLDNSGFNIESEEDFAAIPDDKWDEYVRSISDFHHWESMLSAATEEWTVNKLGL